MHKNNVNKIMMKKLLAAIMISLLAAMPAAAGPFINITGIDADSDFPRIKLTVSVTDPDHKGIPGIDEENIQVYEDGYMVNYVKVREESNPGDYLHVVIVVDSSKSINEKFLSKIKSEAGNFINSAAATDRIAVIRFNDSVRLLNNFTSNRIELQTNIRSIERHGKDTRLYDAVYDSIELLDKIKGGRKGVVVFTDGKDEGSSLTADDVIAFARDTGIPLYFIANNGKTSAHLGRIAKLAGGKYFCIQGRDVAGTYQAVISRIKSVYEIKYQSIIKRDNAKHSLEVRLRYGDLKDRDTAEFTAEKDRFRLDFPDGFYIIASALVIALITVLFVLVIHFFRKSKARLGRRDDSYDEPCAYSSPVRAEDLVREESYSDEPPREIPDVLYSHVWLHQKDGRDAGKKIPVIRSEITLGASDENAVIVEDGAASAKHARIRRMEGGYYLFDLISDNGTYLNGKKILRPRLLHDWDEIRVGNTGYIFRGLR